MKLAEELRQLEKQAKSIRNAQQIEEATRVISEARESAKHSAEVPTQRWMDYKKANQILRDSLASLLTADQQKDLLGRRLFPSRDSKQVWGTSAIGTTYLNLKGTNELVLGDSVDVSTAYGNMYSVNLAHDDKALLKYPAPAGTPADDGEGPKIINLSGIASEVAMGYVVLDDGHDVDPTVPSWVTLANVRKAKLLQASVKAASAKLILEGEWLDPKQVMPALENCPYASFTLSSADFIDANSFSEIPFGVDAVGSEQAKNYFKMDGMQDHQYFLMPEKMKEHIGSDEVSRIKYTKTARQATVHEMESYKNISYTKNYSFVSHAEESHDWTVTAVTKTSDTYAAATMENEMTAVSLSMRVMGTDLRNDLGLLRLSMDAYPLIDETNLSTGLETYVGAKIKSGVAYIRNGVVSLATDAASFAVSCFNFENAQLASRNAAVELANRGVVAQQGSFAILSPRVQVAMSAMQIIA